MRDERGFTLVEILISVAILGILMASIGAALFVSLRTNDATKQRFARCCRVGRVVGGPRLNRR